jgi:hypothetical protein
MRSLHVDDAQRAAPRADSSRSCRDPRGHQRVAFAELVAARPPAQPAPPLVLSCKPAGKTLNSKSCFLPARVKLTANCAGSDRQPLGNSRCKFARVSRLRLAGHPHRHGGSCFRCASKSPAFPAPAPLKKPEPPPADARVPSRLVNKLRYHGRADFVLSWCYSPVATEYSTRARSAPEAGRVASRTSRRRCDSMLSVSGLSRCQ